MIKIFGEICNKYKLKKLVPYSNNWNTDKAPNGTMSNDKTPIVKKPNNRTPNEKRLFGQKA